jgi:chaperone modulatory protein CbpM
MTSVHVVCQLIEGLEVRELERWIVERWVLPDGSEGAFVFHEIDIARVRLIVELRRDLAIDDEAMPVVLGLLDQVYALRRRLKGIAATLAGLPPQTRSAIETHLREAGLDPLTDDETAN